MEKDFNLTDNTANVLSPSGRELERGKFCHIHMNSPKRKLDGVKSTFCSFLSLCFGCKEKEMNQRKRNTVPLRASCACRDGRYRSVSMLTIASHVRNICEHCLSAASLRARCHAKREKNAVADCRKRQRVFFSFVYFFSFASRQKKRNRHMQPAFTMAEILIVIGILGLVADMTIPTLITKVNDKALKTAKIVANLKFEEALNQMRANDKLTGYDTADKFANEFTKYIKTVQRCSSDNLTKCFIDKIKLSNDEEVETENLKSGANIALDNPGNYSSNNVGLTLPNGVMAILNYDKTCEWLDPLKSGGSNRKEAAKCLSMIYDVNGRKKPNKFGEDIVALNAKITSGFECIDVGGVCISVSDIPFDPTDEPCIGGDGANNCAGGKNYWAGARDACRNLGGRLISYNEINNNQFVKDYFHNNTSGSFWASEVNGIYAYIMYSGSPSAGIYNKQISGVGLRCVK